MKALSGAFLTFIALYAMIYFQIIPYQLVSTASLNAMKAQIDQASPAQPHAPGQASAPAPAAAPAPASASASAPASAPAPASAAPARLPAPVVSTQLIADYHGALLLVEGQKGVGTGFLCNLDGHTYAITNAHVLADNIGVKLTSLDGGTFTAGASSIAVGHDIVKMEVASAPKTFELMANPDLNAKVGDSVIVLGNAEGGGVVRPVQGQIVGIGPDLIEVDAPFVKGNSGSPIIHAATGKVIGIATYITERKVSPGDNGIVSLGERRFGYRLDTVKTWQPIYWQTFFAEAAEVAQIEKLSQDFIQMSRDLSGQGLVPQSYQNSIIRQAITAYVQDASRRGLSKNDKIDLVHNFIAELRSQTRNDIVAFNAHPSYDYFHREVEDESRFREQLYDVFSREMANLQQ